MSRTSQSPRSTERPYATARTPSIRTSDDTPIDLEHLARYTFGDVALEAEILGLFSTQTDDLFGQLRSASAGPEWKFATHSLKGSARAVGAWAVAELAAEAELCEPATPAAMDLVERIATEIVRAQAFVRMTYPDALKQSA